MKTTIQNATTQFAQHFDMCYANTPALQQQVLRLRYDVYCREFHYEPEDHHTDCSEHDQYDDTAQHMMVIHRNTQLPVGCVRLIIPPATASHFLLPLEQHSGHVLNHPEHHPQRLPAHSFVEMSRLTVHSSFRRRIGEHASPVGALDDEYDCRTFPLIALALLSGVIATLALTQRQHVFTMLEPRFACHMTAFGFPWTQIGEPIHYHGVSVAYHLTYNDCLQGWNHSNEHMLLTMYQHVLLALQQSAPAP